VNVGDIFRIRTTLVTPPKQKIVVYVGSGLFLWFNTEARQRPAQMSVSSGEVPGISRDCFLDCGRVTVFPERERNLAVLCGRANENFLLRVAQEIEERAITLVTGHRKAVAIALRGAAADR
jgi:hypothetical protein